MADAGDLARAPHPAAPARAGRADRGLQPSIIDEIEEAIQRIRAQSGRTVLLVEQYVDFAQRLADDYVVMAKARSSPRGDTRDLSAETLRHHLSV